MTDRTFHKRFSVPAKCGVAVFVLLTGYFFWVKVAIIGILLAIVIALISLVQFKLMGTDVEY